MGRHYAGQFPVLSNPWQAGSRRRYQAVPMVLLELRCSCCIGQWLSSRRVILLKRWGEKSQAVAGRKQCAVSSGVSTGGKCKGKYAKEIPEPKRNNNIILSNNLLFMKHSSERERKKKAYQFLNSLWKNNKTTNCSHGGKMQMKWKTFFCHHLPLSTATGLWTLFHWANRKSNTVPLINLESLTFIKTGNKKFANQ